MRFTIPYGEGKLESMSTALINEKGKNREEIEAMEVAEEAREQHVEVRNVGKLSGQYDIKGVEMTYEPAWRHITKYFRICWLRNEQASMAARGGNKPSGRQRSKTSSSGSINAKQDLKQALSEGRRHGIALTECA